MEQQVLPPAEGAVPRKPSTGLDPQARLFVHERVAALHADGVTIVLTTHDMDEAAKLCDRVGIIDHGKLLTLDTPDELTKSLPGSNTVSVTVSTNGHEPAKITKGLSEVDGVQRAACTVVAPGRRQLRRRGLPPGWRDVRSVELV